MVPEYLKSRLERPKEWERVHCIVMRDAWVSRITPGDRTRI
jgi:hypothetical protein